LSQAAWNTVHLRKLVLELCDIITRAESLWDDLSKRILTTTTTVPDGKPGVEIPVRGRDWSYGDSD
jgi:hypothetical protein